MNDNAIKFIRKSARFYRLLFDDLKNATRSVKIQMYCVEQGAYGDELKRILKDIARQGVEVDFMYDSAGSLASSSSYFDNMDGVNVTEYHPVNPRRVSGKYSFNKLFRRNHRKIVIIDSHIWYLGGMNIGERFIDWEDIMLRGEGGPVDDLCNAVDRIFNKNSAWRQMHLKTPQPQVIEVCDCRPRVKHYPTKRLYISSIKKAKERVWIAQAYFVPRRKLIRALSRAAGRGVDVRIIVPDISDVKVVDLATWPVIRKLVNKGVKVFRFKERMLHAKIAIIDNKLVTIGTANLDSMSFYWNLELNLLIRDPEIIETAADIFIDYIKHSREVDESEIKTRPLPLRILGRICYSYSWIL
ncbi:Cardiolipin synthetase [hydrothermal vent metagenome]|uniref:Cardiolipin synthetase n=1 Tax=hydrothermal vent metagenome TaxID=652676 RepID=A0A3B1C168_9ZZZZ